MYICFRKKFPVNISNPDDLGNCAKVFCGQEVYLMGISDVLVRHEAYTGIPSAASVHSISTYHFRTEQCKSTDEPGGDSTSDRQGNYPYEAAGIL